MRSRDRVRRIVTRIIVWLALAAFAVVSIYPFAWMVTGAFKPLSEVIASGSLWSDNWTADAFVAAWSSFDFARYFVNSATVTSITLVLIFLVYPAAAYSFSVFTFRGREPLFWMFVGFLFVPSIATLLPTILLQGVLGVLGTHFGLGLVFAAGAAPLAILLLRTAFDAIPRELREAARIDGANEFWIFVRVYLPLARPALATIGVLAFVDVWNEYVVSAISLNDPSLFTLPIGLGQLASEHVVHWNEVMAGSVILVVPILVVYLVGQRYLRAGVVGAIKG